jgi:hypothetical protein
MTVPGTNEPCRRTPPTSDDGGKDRTYGVPHAPAPQPIAHLIIRHEFTHGRNVRHRSPWTPPVRSCPTPTAPSSLAGIWIPTRAGMPGPPGSWRQAYNNPMPPWIPRAFLTSYIYISWTIRRTKAIKPNRSLCSHAECTEWLKLPHAKFVDGRPDQFCSVPTCVDWYWKNRPHVPFRPVQSPALVPCW